MWSLVCLSLMAAGDRRSSIRADEQVVFYPTYACRADGDAAWTVSIHGLVCEPELDSLKRTAALELFRHAFGLSRQDSASEIFKERARHFLVDNEGGKSISIRLGGRTYAAGTSAANGHFSNVIRVDAAEIDRLRRSEADKDGWLRFQAVTRPGDARTFAGRVQLLGPEGRSVISDVDDTIKITQVHDPRAMLTNTLMRPFAAVPGMAALYRQWADQGTAFHYVSGSPWQLYEPLSDFVRAEGLPAGTFHLKLLRLKDASAWTFFGPQDQYKTGVIERILADFPRRRFVCVGDSGEQDPEIYAAVAKKHAKQIERILIRNVGGRGSEPERFQKAFDGIPRERWKVFDKPDQCLGAS